MAADIKIALTREELWELISNFDKSFDSDDPDNAVASRVADKLADALERHDNKRK